jgi:Xaa-Pro dipeptidase
MAEPMRDPEFPQWQAPTFSMEERERRWGRVRELMRREGIDCLVALANSGSHDRNNADARYLSQIGNNTDQASICFPLEGKVTAITNWGGHWPAGEWIGETRQSLFGATSTMIECLREAGLDRGTIGVCGLTRGTLSSVRQPDGNAVYGAVKRLQEALPDARFVSATSVMGEARYVKSTEEIEFLRKAITIAERSLQAMLQTVRVGIFEPVVMANMYQAAIAAGGSLPNMFGWVSGPFGHCYHRLEQPAHRQMESGDYIYVEIEGRWGGYVAQLDQSVTLGDVPAWAPEAHKIAVECFWDVVHAMRPGATFGELKEAATKVGRYPNVTGSLIMHGRGLGDDGPLILAEIQPESPAYRLPLLENTVFIVKPYVTYDGMREVGHVGDTVAVTATGAERLGTRPIEHYWHVD